VTVAPTLTVNPVNLTYGTALANGQLSGTVQWTVGGNTVNVPGTFAYTSAAGTLLGAGNAQIEGVTFTPSDVTDFMTSTSAVTVNVGPATPTVTSVNPVNITFGTALANGQLSGTFQWTVGGSTVNVPGTFAYTSAAGTVLPAGSGQTEAVTFTPTDMTDYTTAASTVTVNVTAANVSSASSEIIDNSQPGFWASGSGTWTTINTGLNGSSLVSATTNGSEQSKAAWWFSMPTGVYEISITYTPGSNLTTDLGLDVYDGNGNWLGQIPVNEQVAPDSFTEDGVAWENLGAFRITNNVFHISTWNSSTSGALCINGIQLQAAPIIDDSDAPGSYTYYPPAASIGDFTTSGSWTTSSQGAFGGSHVSTSTAGSGSSIAKWIMPVSPGSYEIDVTWPAGAALSANAKYNIYDGNTKLGSVAVNQQAAPSGISYDGLNWQSLGTFAISSTQLTVTLANTASDGQVDADAIRILPSYQPAEIVGSGSYPGFWSNTAWTTQDTGLYGNSMVSNSPNGSEQSQAAWWFPVQPGQYQVFATWVPGSNLTSTAPFDVYNALTYLSEPVVDEQDAPVGVTDQGVVWQSLGTFSMTSNVLHVSTWNSQTNGAMCLSGIRIVPVGT
jgi:hypothetical protein